MAAADAVADLKAVALENGTLVETPWAGQEWFGGALRVLGPSQDYYEDLIAEQVQVEFGSKALAHRGGGNVLLEAARGIFDRVATALGTEIPLEAGVVNARNNSSMITLWQFDGETALLTGDAGVPALDRAWDTAAAFGLDHRPAFVQVPHHGSRRNCSSAWLDRVIGPIGGAGGAACVSAVNDSDKHPSGRVVNAYSRRGYDVCATAGQSICWKSDGVPQRAGWGPVTPLGPMDEGDED